MISIDKDNWQGIRPELWHQGIIELGKGNPGTKPGNKNCNGKEVKYDKKGWGGGNYIGGEILGVEDKLLINIVSYSVLIGIVSI